MKRNVKGSRWVKMGLGLIPWLTLTAILIGCASSPVSEPPGSHAMNESAKAKGIETEARPLYFQAERAFAAKNYDLAQRLFGQVRTKFPRTHADSFSAYRLGIIQYYRENYAAASKNFEYHLRLTPQSDFSFDAIYNLAACEYQLGHFDRAYQVLSRLRLSEVQAQGPRRAQVVLQLTARIAAALNNHSSVIAANAMQMQLPIEDQTRAALTTSVDEHLAKMTEKNQLEQLASEITEPNVHAQILARIQALANGTTTASAEPAAPALGTAATASGPNPLGTLGSTGQRFNVGVLLPLTGRGASYGKRALDGILLASNVFNAAAGSEIKLFIQDTASNPTIAEGAVDDLVRNKDVVAILGPLNYKEANATAEKAQALGVLNLSLTAKEGVSKRGSYLFQNALTPRVQLDSMVRYCISEKKFTRFAILAPKNAFGQDMSHQFWDLVEKYGGKVVDYSVYNPDETDFRDAVKEMTGLDNLKFRRLETAKLAEYVHDQKLKTGKEPRVQLPPIIDFDALFIPDSPKTVAQIAPSLAYFDVTGVSLLGTTEWNSDQFYSRGGKYVEGAIFPGGLNLGTRNPAAQDFIKLYQDSYGSFPDLLAAQAFEAMEMLAVAIKNSASDDRNAVVNQLAALRDFDTPLGKITFDSDRLALRRLPVLTLENGGAVTEHY